jgi:peptidyl-prolyl cis-trans isomerase C
MPATQGEPAVGIESPRVEPMIQPVSRATAQSLAARPAKVAQRITLSDSDVRRLVALWASRWRREPTPEELQGLLEEEVREEILYREALTLDLAKDDMVVKRYLAQKVGMMVADLAALRKRDPAEVRAWFERNRERFALPPRVSFRHLYFSFDLRQAQTRQDATAALADLVERTSPPTAHDEPGDSFMFRSFYGDHTPSEIGQVFGHAFAQVLFRFEPGAWQGPVESGYGWHLVWIDSVTPGRVPTFDEIEPTVISEWLAEQRADARNKFYEAARKKYQVEVPESIPSLSRFKPMSSAPFVYRDDGRPDWGSMWKTYCELALYGGPPHRGEANALTAPSEPQQLTTEMKAVQEIIRGIYETTGLEAQPAEPGWIAVACNSRKMAAWLCATIIIENVEARCEGERLLLPASPDFTLEKQIKSVITVLAKTNHYWQAHVNGVYSPQLDTIQWQQS